MSAHYDLRGNDFLTLARLLVVGLRTGRISESRSLDCAGC